MLHVIAILLALILFSMTGLLAFVLETGGMLLVLASFGILSGIVAGLVNIPIDNWKRKSCTNKNVLVGIRTWAIVKVKRGWYHAKRT